MNTVSSPKSPTNPLSQSNQTQFLMCLPNFALYLYLSTYTHTYPYFFTRDSQMCVQYLTFTNTSRKSIPNKNTQLYIFPSNRCLIGHCRSQYNLFNHIPADEHHTIPTAVIITKNNAAENILKHTSLCICASITRTNYEKWNQQSNGSSGL